MEFPTRHAYLRVFSKTEINTHEHFIKIDSLGPDVNGFHISFYVVKSLAPNSNRANISVYNLSQKTRKTISSNGLWCELYAGYLGNEHLLFAGEIKNSFSEREGADIITTLVCQTDWKLEAMKYSKSFPAQTPVRDILNNIIKQANLPTTSNTLSIADDKLSYQLVFTDTVEATLDKLANMFHFAWSMQDYGFLAVSDTFAFINSQKIDSLIKSVEIIPKENDRASSGFAVNCILNSSFMVGDLVEFVANYQSGRFKIYELFYSGDTVEGEWAMNLEGFAPGSLIVQPTKTKTQPTPSFWAELPTAYS
ncbi:MAG: hypothetical protein LBE95_03775 [Holosporaceae bacterium]|jgi:hypothetical protein|nr:hypothetical protein [Holosporaceae bacterium]